jgi:hypothetical protein
MPAKSRSNRSSSPLSRSSPLRLPKPPSFGRYFDAGFSHRGRMLLLMLAIDIIFLRQSGMRTRPTEAREAGESMDDGDVPDEALRARSYNGARRAA